MPYANDSPGLYTITCKNSKRYYVGSSKRVKKRVAEHLRLLRLEKHPNQNLQRCFNDFGENNLDSVVEVSCQDIVELRYLEQQCLSGEMWFSYGDRKNLLNIASDVRGVMTGRKHSVETKRKYSEIRKGKRDHITGEYRKKLSQGQERRRFSDPEFLAKIKYILYNEDMTYAARARYLGIDSSSVRKLYLRYKDRKDELL